MFIHFFHQLKSSIYFLDFKIDIDIGKRQSAPEGVSPIQWWIFTDNTSVFLEVADMRGTELSKPTDLQTSSNTPQNTRDNVDEGQSVSANMPDTISISSSEMRSEKTSKETDVVVVQSENIGKYA